MSQVVFWSLMALDLGILFLSARGVAQGHDEGVRVYFVVSLIAVLSGVASLMSEDETWSVGHVSSTMIFLAANSLLIYAMIRGLVL